MGRDDRQDRQQRRSQEDLDKGLKRGDVDLACAGLMGLPAELRTPSLAAVGQLARRELHARFARHEWAAIRTLGARFDQEPRLMAGSDDDDDAVRWVLFWAAVRQPEEAARRLQALGADALPLPLRQALEALVAGTLTPELLPPGCADDDERLGKEPVVGKSARRPAPTTTAEVEPALLQLVALRGFSGLAGALRDWVSGAAPGVAVELRRVGAALALRELLLRTRLDGALAEPCLLLAELMKGADVDVARCCVLGLRVLVQRARALDAKAVISDRATAQALLTLGAAVAADPGQRAFALQLLERLRFHDDVAAVVLPGLEALLATSPRIGLWIEAAQMWSARTNASAAPPPWLAKALGALVDEGAFARAFTGAPDNEQRALRRDLLHFAVTVVPVALAERALDQAFAAVDDEGRSGVAAGVTALLARMRTDALVPRGGWKSLVQRDTFHQLLDVMEDDDDEFGDDGGAVEEILDHARDAGLTANQAMDIVELASQAAQLGGGAQEAALAARWSARLLPVHERFLEDALKEAGDAGRLTIAEALRLARVHVGARTDVKSWVKALELLDQIEPRGRWTPIFGDAFVPLLVAQFADDVAGLARALVLTRHAPPRIRTVIGAGLLAAVDRHGPQNSEEVRHAMKAREKGRAKAKAKAKEKAKAKAKEKANCWS
ncbi:MAG: DUF6109 family natural product biosynthesis protein [Deltaproteobacteria bacterium]|nr:DUF6109 family natural product biosynthesis protein [Deltaproteobacteria bacterium]